MKVFGVLSMMRIGQTGMLQSLVSSWSSADMALVPGSEATDSVWFVLLLLHLDSFFAACRLCLHVHVQASQDTPSGYIIIHTGAVPSSYNYYGNTENVPFVLRNPTCQGREDSLFQCVDNQFSVGKTGKYRGDSDAERNTVGVRCQSKLIFNNIVKQGAIGI